MQDAVAGSSPTGTGDNGQAGSPDAAEHSCSHIAETMHSFCEVARDEQEPRARQSAAEVLQVCTVEQVHAIPAWAHVPFDVDCYA